MATEYIIEKKIVGEKYCCDACGKNIEGKDIGWSYTPYKNLKYIICLKCFAKIPSEVLDNIDGKDYLARMANNIFSSFCDIRDYVEDELDSDDFPDLNKGIWLFFSDNEDYLKISFVKNIEEITKCAYDREYNDRMPTYLKTILIDGKIQKFKKVYTIQLESEINK